MTQAKVDRLAEIRSAIKELSEEESAIKAELLALNQNIIEGDRFDAILKLVPQSRIDTDGLKKEFGLPWYKAHCKVTESVRIETIAKAA